jgi:hypothetical protein
MNDLEQMRANALKRWTEPSATSSPPPGPAFEAHRGHHLLQRRPLHLLIVCCTA